MFVRRLRRMLVKEFLQMFRDPRMRMVIFVMPMMQMLVFAFALTTDVDQIATAVLDYDNTPQSREVVAAFTSSDYFELAATPATPRDVNLLLDKGEVRAVIHIQKGFAEAVAAGEAGLVQLITDGSNSNSAAIIDTYAEVIAANLNQQGLRTRILARGIDPPGTVTVTPRPWYNPNLESKAYFIPGIIAVMLATTSILLTSISIVREKEIGTIEQIMVTPIGKLEFILGKTVPYMIVAYILMTGMFLMAMAVFGVGVKGSWLLLYALTGVYLASNLGLALFISATASTQQQALLTAFFLIMPVVLLSGFMYPVKNMPEVVQYVTFANPMRWYMEILRGVAMKGVGLSELSRAVIGECVLALFFMVLARSKFKKTIA